MVRTRDYYYGCYDFGGLDRKGMLRLAMVFKSFSVVIRVVKIA